MSLAYKLCDRCTNTDSLKQYNGTIFPNSMNYAIYKKFRFRSLRRFFARVEGNWGRLAIIPYTQFVGVVYADKRHRLARFYVRIPDIFILHRHIK